MRRYILIAHVRILSWACIKKIERAHPSRMSALSATVGHVARSINNADLGGDRFRPTRRRRIPHALTLAERNET